MRPKLPTRAASGDERASLSVSAICRQRDTQAPRVGPPPFAGIEPAERRCSSPDCPVPGGAILSRHNTDPDGLCHSCRTAGRRPRYGLVMGPPPDDLVLWEVVAGLLLLGRNLRPGEPLDLRRMLSDLGIEVTREELKVAIRCCRRRDMRIASEPGRVGHELVEFCRAARRGCWPRRRPQLELFPRDGGR